MAANSTKTDLLPQSPRPQPATSHDRLPGPVKARSRQSRNQDRQPQALSELIDLHRQLPGDIDALLSEKKVALLLDVSVAKLQRDRWSGGGIPFVKMNNRTVRYRLSDVAKWIERLSRHSSTADPGPQSLT